MPARTALRARLRTEDGAVMVLSALVIVVLFAAVAFVIDLSRLWHERQVLQNAVDFGALAGAQELPATDSATGSIAAAEALRVTIDNAPWISPSQVSISFRCVVGDRDGDGAPDLTDVPHTCGPQTGTWPIGEWRTRRGRSIHACDPTLGDRCNTISVRTSNDVSYVFAPVMGIDEGNTGGVSAASCRGSCGAAPSPLDVAVVFDRSNSMTTADMANARNATLALLDFYDSNQHHVGLVGLPYHNPSRPCEVRSPQNYPNTVAATWILHPLASNYDRPDGTLNPASTLVQRISCLLRAPSGLTTNPSGAGHTDLGDPMAAASSMLQTSGRGDVPDVIIFLSDGEANQPRFNQPCHYANTRATAAKAADVEIFTIAYGVAGAQCGYDTSGSPWRGRLASTFFAAMATDSTDDAPGACAATENTDGDHYFCESGSSDLEPVFRQVAEQALGHSRLVDDF